MILWRYGTTSGLWTVARICSPETANEWLKVFQRDEPNVRFVLSKRKPKV